MGSEAMQHTHTPLTGQAPGAHACGGPPGLDMPAAAALYEIAAACGGRGDIAAISAQSGLGEERAAAGWRTLAELTLVRIRGGQVETLGSDAALDAVVGRYASYAFEVLRSVRAVNDTTRRLLTVFGSGASEPDGAPAVLPFAGAAYTPYDDRIAPDLAPDAWDAGPGSAHPHPHPPLHAEVPYPARESEPQARADAPRDTAADDAPAVEPYAGAHGRERVLRALAGTTALSADCLYRGGLPGDPAVLEAYLEMTGRLVRRGVRVRALCTPAMLRAPGGARYARHVVAAGAQVRVADRVGHAMLICDGRTVCLPDGGGGDPGDPGVLCITSPRLARTFLTVYETYWRRAVPYPPANAAPPVRTVGDAPPAPAEPAVPAPQLGSFEQAVVRLMAAGRDDDAIARELGVDAGTVAGVMAGLMRRLGAATRFEAGIRLARALEHGRLP